MPINSRINTVIHGRVQGIGYRWFVQRTARMLSLTGWVKNLDDGSVEIEAEGTKETLDGFLNALNKDHPGAYIKDVKTEWMNTTKRTYFDFEIRF
ncbi:MAG: acylphosphatase [Endomicrobiales bacterium]|nr:acylphosphatase [Endomicrobiales bacterium]